MSLVLLPAEFPHVQARLPVRKVLRCGAIRNAFASVPGDATHHWATWRED